MNPNVQKARQNELQLLLAVGVVGWLTTAQAAAWVWHDKGQHAARNRAGETVLRLLRSGHLLRRQTPTGVWAHVLTHAGAARANEALTFDLCRPGYDLSQLDVLRQRLIVEYLLARPEPLRLGPAGVRGAVRTGGMIDDSRLQHADALTRSADGVWTPAMVARSLHPALIAKARILRAAAGFRLVVLGHPYLVRQFRAAVDADQQRLEGSW